MTNREVLARKSNEELAKWLADITEDNQQCALYCIYAKSSTEQCIENGCEKGIQQWLEQEAKEE